MTAPTHQLLEWIVEQPRTYADTIDAWRTTCPRLAVWEDALTDGLVRVDARRVTLTEAGARELVRETAAILAADRRM